MHRIRTGVRAVVMLLFMSSVFFALRTHAQGNGEFSVYLPLISVHVPSLEGYRGVMHRVELIDGNFISTLATMRPDDRSFTPVDGQGWMGRSATTGRFLVTKTDRISDQLSVYNLWVTDAAGQNAQRLTAFNTRDDGDIRGEWSPDGYHIALGSHEYYYNSRRYTSLYITTPDRTVPIPIVTDTILSPINVSPDVQDFPWQWSPDGSMLAYYIQGDTPDVWDLYVVPMATGIPVHIPQTTRLGATWSPDGSKLLIVTARNDTLDIATATPDGQTLEFLTDTPEIEFRADWIEGGSKVLVSRTDGTLQQLVLYSTADGTTTPFTNALSEIHIISISPDGYKVLWHDGNAFYGQSITAPSATMLNHYYPLHLFVTPVRWSDDSQLALWTVDWHRVLDYVDWRSTTPNMRHVPIVSVLSPRWLPHSHILSAQTRIDVQDVLVSRLWNMDTQTFTTLPFPGESDFHEWWIEPVH